MFGRMVRQILDAAVEAANAQRDEGQDRLDDILSIPSPALRAYFEEILATAQWPDPAVANQRAQAAFAAAFADDPLGVGLALLQRAPIMTMLRNSDPGRYHTLEICFQGATEAARRAATAGNGSALPINDRLLPLALHSLGVIVAQGHHHLQWGYGAWLEPVVRTAARSQDPAVRQALLAMFDAFGQCQPHVRDATIAVAERLLPLAGLPRSAIGLLAGSDKAGEKRDTARARIVADAGPLLGAAIAAALDNEPPTADYSLKVAEKHPALKALADQSPEARGADFGRIVDIVTGFERYGAGQWGEIERRNGRYGAGNNYNPHPQGIANILGTLATRKMVLAEPDRDAARLVDLLPDYFMLSNHRRILAFLLETAAAHPQGATAPALRKLIGLDQIAGYYTKWIADIEDTLRDLPAAAPPTAPAQSAPASHADGFGRKGPDGSAPVAGPAPVAGLAPVALPDFRINRWEDWRKIDQHFDALFDVRLHDETHRGFLDRLAALADAIEALPTDNRASLAKAAAAKARELGCPFEDDYDLARLYQGLGHGAEVGRDIQRRFAAFAPFVTSQPDEARRLGKLASAIAPKSAPPAKWLAEARALAAQMPTEQRLDLLRTLALLTPASPGYNGGEHIQRTLIYLSADLDPAAVGPMLTDYALKKCYVTVPGQGIRAEKLGNAVLWTLAAMPNGAGVPYLARILARTKYPKIRAKVDERLNEAAAAAGLSRSALDELTVPTHDLDRDGEARFEVGGGEAVLRIHGSRNVAIEWRADGRVLKAPSVAMKADKEALKAAREAAKEIEADLGTLVVRLQRLYLDDRSWGAAEWRERYLDHPLVRSAARRLIWRVEGPDGTTTSGLADAAGETLLDAAGKSVAIDGATIRLWHPIESAAAEVEAWRDRLEALEIVQPFAQAWREVYAVTDAERATATYSNRWAAHLLKQHQAMTLARLNGWRTTHRMWVDAPNDEPWHVTIPAHGLVADYWVKGAGGDDPEVSESGAYAYVATDRVQFHSVAPGARDSAEGPMRGRAVALVDIPPIVFSEVMRQVDLLSAVASIAADPNWLDRGGDAAHPSQWHHDADAYWKRINGAELEESGKRRRAMLERIVPRLKIAGQLSFDDRHLVVEGKRHRYRIHLGSGACFRGERHLCIVPKLAENGGRIWLPFEGDRTLSIILSKALLLAEDDRITDPVILAQL